MVPSNIRAETGLYAITPTLLYLVAMEWLMWESTRYQNNGIRRKIESTLDVLEYADNICLISLLISKWKTTKLHTTSRSLGLDTNFKKKPK